MKKEPIFELFLDPKNKSDRHYVRIYVDLNGKRMSLIDALYRIEAAFIKKKSEQSDFGWQWPENLYESIVEVENGKRVYFRPIRCNVLNFKMVETETQIVWSIVLINWAEAWDGKVAKMLTAKDGIMPKGFHTFPVYPDFVFDKTQFREELELLRPFYEEDQRAKAEHHAEWERCRMLNTQWDAETLKHEIDFDSLKRPKYISPIFIVSQENKRDIAEIHVDWEGRRMPLIDVLKI